MTDHHHPAPSARLLFRPRTPRAPRCKVTPAVHLLRCIRHIGTTNGTATATPPEIAREFGVNRKRAAKMIQNAGAHRLIRCIDYRPSFGVGKKDAAYEITAAGQDHLKQFCRVGGYRPKP